MKTFALMGLGVLFVGCGGGGAAPAMDAAVADVVAETVAEVAVDVTPDLGPTMVNFGLTDVAGTFSGDGVNVQAARTDMLALKACTFTSTGTAATQMALLGATALTKPLAVTGTWSCPAGMATSTGAPASCMTQASTSTTNMLQVVVAAAGWEDDSVVTLTVTYPPGVISACNYATVVVAAPGWGMTGTTTAGKFKALVPFTVSFVGAKVLTAGTNTSNVAWDFAMTVAPTL